MKRAILALTLMVVPLLASSAEASWAAATAKSGAGHTTCWTKTTNGQSGKFKYTPKAC